ncbi:Rne/Rng family ribonuclease [Nonomuraea soli]|uniref:Ribonuclease E n=1 Tax=Nonomuraea soli TaxID=1032476 RepID=A0A7W0CTI9_9ACTN|nr:Rne/Rng family ribonuclease [Nonomuraea soli]MBA2896928.1 ribonuclease E [Nonomuraea soli]
MLDNEPNAGAASTDGDTSEETSATRRRSASRPAGAPPDDTPSVIVVGGGAEEAKPKKAATTRRRTTKKAEAAEAAEAVSEAAATTGGSASLVEEPAASAAPVRKATRAAGPPPEVDEGAAPVVTTTAGSAAVVEAASAPAPASKGRARRAKAAPADDIATSAGSTSAGSMTAGPVMADSTASGSAASGSTAGGSAAAGSAAGGSVAAGSVAGGSASAGEAVEEAPVKRTRSRKKAVPESVAESVLESAIEAVAAAEDEVPAGTTRRTRKAAATRTTRGGKAGAIKAALGADDDEDAAEGVGAPDARRAGEPVTGDILEELPEDEPLDDEPAGEDLDVEPIDRPGLLADPFGFSARGAEQPGATFQRPAAIFTPLFQAPDPTQAIPARVEPVVPVPVPVPAPAPAEADEAELDEGDDEGDEGDDLDREESGSRRRRRRRGGRGRGKARERDDADDSEDGDEGPEEESAEADSDEESGVGSRRRRRRRRRGDDSEDATTADDPPNTVVRIRAPRSGRAAALLDVAADGVQSVRGSTRLEAKKQRRREGRELGRRRPPIITESEFLARREAVDRMMVVRRIGDRTQIAVLEDGVLVEHYVNREASQSYVGNVYLGKVQNVLPSMEAAFVDIGKGRNAVLYAGEVNFDTAGLEGQPKRIETALKSGQSVLVQVTKDPIGHKGARLTSQISLPGRYLVYVPDGSMTGISRKLPDKERTRLKSILKKVMPENAGVIVRTAAEGASEEELGRDVARLSAQWENIQKKAKSASPPELLSAEPDLTIRVVRDVFNEDFSSLVVQDEEAWETVEEYVRYVAPHLEDRLSRWDESEGDVFAHYRVDEQLGKALDRKVWLPSGGSLVIDRTEAMTVVDVNTGKFTGQGGNLEETVTRNNLEAAEEIVRQLRLRDIGGIIVIDFIDMVLESNRDLVLRRLLECLARDRTKHQVAEVTSLGLVQMTRKRVGQGLLEAFSTPCDCCNGRGLIVSTEPVEAKSEARGTQGKMAVEKAVADKVSAASAAPNRDTVTGALEDVPTEDDSANQTSGRGRRRSRRAKSAD